MSMEVKEVRAWLERLKDDEVIGIDEGGLALMTEDETAYIEIGGIREREDG